MARLMHVHTVDTRPFLLRREGPGDKAIGAPDAPVITVRCKASVIFFTFCLK